MDNPKTVPYTWETRYSDHNSTDGWKYETDSESLDEEADIMDMLSDDKVTVAVERFNIGGKSTVTISTDEEGVSVSGAWGVGDISELVKQNDRAQSDWTPWSSGSMEFYPTGGSYQGVIVAPEFLPAGSQKYSIIGGYLGNDGVHYNHIVIKDGESKSSAGSDDDTILGMDSTVFLAASISVVALLVIIIIVVIVVIFIVKSKKKSPAATPAPAPAQGANDLPPPPPAGFNAQGQPATSAQPGLAPPPPQPGEPAQPGAPGQPAPAGQPPGQAAPPPDPSLFPQGQTSSQPGQPQVMDQGGYYPPPPPPKQY